PGSTACRRHSKMAPARGRAGVRVAAVSAMSPRLPWRLCPDLLYKLVERVQEGPGDDLALIRIAVAAQASEASDAAQSKASTQVGRLRPAFGHRDLHTGAGVGDHHHRLRFRKPNAACDSPADGQGCPDIGDEA